MSSRDIRIKRIYDPPARSDGYRVLVDRLWPRGVSKNGAALNEWLREIAPSNELRQWFGHDRARASDAFVRRQGSEVQPGSGSSQRPSEALEAITSRSLRYDSRDRCALAQPFYRPPLA